MRKFLIVLAMVAMASLLMGAGCFVTPEPNQAPSITSTAITSGKVGVEYTYGVEATDPDEGDYVIYSLTEKPLDMSIVATTGIISWIPTDAGVFAVGVKVSDGELSDSQKFNITVIAADEPIEPAEKSEAPVITSVLDADDGYINKTESITIVTGYGVDGSIVKLYLDGKLIGTTTASKTRSSYAMFEFTDLVIDLGEDGEKTLYATAKEYGLAVSDPSDPYTFMLKTTLPKLETVSIDGIVFEDGEFVLFLDGTSFKEITAEVSEPVSLVPSDEPDYEPVITLAGTEGVEFPFADGDWATFEISKDGLTLTLTPATAWLDHPDGNHTVPNFYVYREGKMVSSYVEGLVKDVAGNKNAAGSFTLTYVNLTPPEG
ncbi:hypothetical protein ES708_07360 [subsurface metagenome]